MRIGVIGGGVSGIACACALQRLGYDVVVWEERDEPGGIWADVYSGVRLQNVAEQYRLADLPWPEPPDQHPTAEQIKSYVQAAIARFGIDVRLGQKVEATRRAGTGRWEVQLQGASLETVDQLVVATGQFSAAEAALAIPGLDAFEGRVQQTREVRNFGAFAGHDVVVLGLGKSAVDVATFAAEAGARVALVFRTPRWLLPRRIAGVHSVRIVFARMSPALFPAWSHPGRVESALHRRGGIVVRAFWGVQRALVRLVNGMHPLHRDRGARHRMALLTPRDSLVAHLRSALALAPDGFYALVRAGRIVPHHATVVRTEGRGVVLSDGESVPCDVLIPAIGCVSPRFPFLPDADRAVLEGDPDGPQLYRHIVHPDVPGVWFSGFNHSFLHLPCVEVAAVWIDAVLRGELVLPSNAQQRAVIRAVQEYKRAHVCFEPSRGASVNMRMLQHLDLLLGDLGERIHRKRNPLTELVAYYRAGDYAGLIEARVAGRPHAPRAPLELPG